jgi:transposase InsO family protein
VAGEKKAKYLLTAIDCFTRYAVVEPIPNKEAITVAQAIWDHIIGKHGFADLQCDRVAGFCNHYLQAIMDKTGQRLLHTGAFKPSTNGKVEKFHRTFNSMLAKVVDENQKDWPEHITALTFS